MATNQIESLRSEIKARGHDWQPDMTTVSQLPDHAKKLLLGLRVTENELKATTEAIAAATKLAAFRAVEAPAAVNWHDKGGDWTTPIKNQQTCGACVAFGVAATLESRIKIKCENPNTNPDLSEAHLFFCGCGECCDRGWDFASALNFCKNTGVGTESSFPYTPTNQACKTGVTPYIKITAWTQVLAVADRKNILATKGPMVGGMAVYDDFYNYRSGVYRHTSGELKGYHAISVVGYDDVQKCWICKNSWGEEWGDKGWFNIGYGESIDAQFAFYDIDLTCPVIPDKCAEYLPYLKRVLAVAYENPGLCACLRAYVCRGSAAHCTPAQMAVARRVLTILKQCPQYHVAFCRALSCPRP